MNRTIEETNNKLAFNTIGIVLCVTIFMLLLFLSLINLTPPISRDALIHHLAIPKLWLKRGGFYETSWAKYSYYPMNIDLLYLVSLYFKSDLIPKFIHFAFGLATALLVYLYVKNKFNQNWGLLGALIYLSTPIVVRLSTSAYIDLGAVFFVTAAIFAFIKWRDSNYDKVSWLILSAASMGLAAGSKYNAILAWIFLNLMISFYYAKDTRKQLPALKYGLIFFSIALVIASPWYIKNYLLTSNPVYPLFDSIFNASSHNPSTNGSAATGFFQKRELMYGESLWETLLIPVRMFFQGEDHSDQYFDGVLNPILVVMIPVAFLNRNARSDTILFTTFGVYFLVSAFFLAAPRIRYILPVVPLLAIVATTGIKQLIDYSMQHGGLIRHAGIMATLAITIFCLTINFLYLKNHFNTIQPIGYISNEESRDQFIARHVGSYPATEYINKNLPSNAKILLMFMAGRGYYLDRDYYHGKSFGAKTLKELVKAAAEREEDFEVYLQSLPFSHILVRTDLFKKYLADNFEEDAILRFLALKMKYWKQVYGSKGYMVLEVLK